ncbi:MAG: hypothetical protein EVG15_07095 [Candidatus Acididesulfobacter diazotrophicus]|jgi:hypothetical protein|uniref:Restriction endonuclease type I HsdR N-terminal domain-containing protein n=1 Tax=Candidatus Acididesulfobacter diazotrophicus TaxID=2597226 RepID=A0A519BLV0_9DELT|nr:MAG: hypothetical protein EVG15_07095 [Candidatus Acididesulfobacter diazotrophicus]
MYTETQLTGYLDGIRDIITRPEKTHQRFGHGEATFTPVFDRLINYSELNIESVFQEQSIRTGNRPDFSIYSDDKLIGCIECKKTSISLDSEDCYNQVQKYSKEYNNVILTNFIEFRLYQNSRLVDTMLFDNLYKASSENVKHFNNLIVSFFKYGSLYNKRLNKHTDWISKNANNYGFAFPTWEIISLLTGFFVPSVIKNIIFIFLYRKLKSNPDSWLELVEIMAFILMITIVIMFKNFKIFNLKIFQKISQQWIWMTIGTILAVCITFLSTKVAGFPYVLLSPTFHSHVKNDIKIGLFIGIAVIFILASLIGYSALKKYKK